VKAEEVARYSVVAWIELTVACSSAAIAGIIGVVTPCLQGVLRDIAGSRGHY